MPSKPENIDIRKDSSAFNSVEFVTKACSAYIVMMGVGLIVMRYAHQNLESLGSLTRSVPLDTLGFLSFLGPLGSLLVSFVSNNWLTLGLLAAVVMIAFNALCDDWLAEDETSVLEDGQGSRPKIAFKSGPRDDARDFPAGADHPNLDSTPSQILSRIVSRLSYPQVFLMALFAAVGEEILFRGAIQPFVGLFLGSCLYGLIHFSSGWMLTPWNIMGLSKGLFLGWIFQSTASLWPCIVAQLAFNLWTMIHLKRGHSKNLQQLPIPQSNQA